MRIPVFLSLLALISTFCLFGCVQPQGAGNTSAIQGPAVQSNLSPNPPNTANSSTSPLASGNISQVGNASENIIPEANESLNNQSLPLTNQSDERANQSGQENIGGLAFGDGRFILVLDDISVAGATSPCGIFSIRYSINGSIVPGSNFVGCPPESHQWISPDGDSYRIRVEKVAAGHTKESRWAQASIFG